MPVLLAVHGDSRPSRLMNRTVRRWRRCDSRIVSRRRARARAARIAARTCAGAVPPGWLRLATEPSSVSTANTSSPIRGEKRCSSASGSSARSHRCALGVAHRARDRFVRVAKRHALAHQVVGEIGRGREALARRRAHPLGVDRRCRWRPGRSMIASVSAQRVDGVEQRLLVFLVVLVVGERLALHQRQQRDQVADDAPASCRARARATSGFFFCGMIEEPVQKRSASVDEAEARARPQHELLGEAREVHHQRARPRPRIRSRSRGRTPRRASSAQTPSKPSSRATRVAVDREARAGERGAAERQAVDAPAAVGAGARRRARTSRRRRAGGGRT